MDPNKIDISVNEDSKSMQKLLDVCSSGIGAVAGSWLKRWQANANAETKLIEAQASKNAQAIMDGTMVLDEQGKLIEVTAENLKALPAPNEMQARITFQEEKRQRNIANIVTGAAEKMSEEVSEEPVDPDWTASFFNLSQDVTSEEFQDYWSSVLAGEVTKPGSFSLRTLNVLKNISREEKAAFEKMRPYVLNGSFIPSDLKDFYDSKGFLYHDLVCASEAGLVNTNFGDSWALRSVHNYDNKLFFSVKKCDGGFILFAHKSQAKLSIPMWHLTAAGKEIYKMLGFLDCPRLYLNALAKHFHSKNFELFVGEGIHGPEAGDNPVKIDMMTIKKIDPS